MLLAGTQREAAAVELHALLGRVRLDAVPQKPSNRVYTAISAGHPQHTGNAYRQLHVLTALCAFSGVEWQQKPDVS